MAQRYIGYPLAAMATLYIASAAASSPATSAQKAIGTVTLVLGQATVVSADGAQHAIRRGLAVKPGDRVETAQGGHVHIRFVDEALVSVRPSSRLVIEEYQYNPAQVADSQVRFRLETGVARAISGAAAEGAKERFRLNTPLVAIGVRGTDFVVKSMAEQTTAHVNQGAIVMAPLGAGCQANTLGPCNTQAATLVSAQMGDVLAQYRSGLDQPEIKPQMLARPTYLAAAPAPTVDNLSSPAHSQTAKLETASVGPKPDESVVQVSAAIRNGLVATMVDSRAEPPAPAPQEPAPSVPLPPAPVEPPISVQPPQPPALAWGHWAQPAGSKDFSEPFRVAAIGREVTVGNSSHVLYRSLPAEGAASTISPSLGQVGFQLQQASAQFRPWGGANLEATAQSGNLSIDFAARTYQTSLQLSNTVAGNHTLASSGVVLADGIFGGAAGGQSVIGAATLDGKGAGYFFDKTVESGTFSGITLWAR